MQFGNPLVLWALLGLVIPILIHLLRLRKYKTVYFSNVNFLEQIRIESNKMSRIKNLLILISRVLAIAFLVLAFAKPFIPYNNDAKDLDAQQTNIIFVDNSFSMQVGDNYFSKLDEAKQNALKIINSFDKNDNFLLISNTLDASSFRILTQNMMIERVNSLEIQPFTRNIYEVVAIVSEVKSFFNLEKINLFVISDFQNNFLERLHEIDNLNIETFFVPIGTINKDNIGIDSVWLNTPLVQNNQTVEISVLVRNYSSEVYENLSVSLFVNGERKAISSIDLNSNSENVLNLNFIPDNNEFFSCYIQIEDQNLNFDNKLFFSINIAKSIDVTVLSGRQGINSSFKALFENEEFFNFKFSNFHETNLTAISKNGLIIFDAVESFSQSKINEIIKITNDFNNIVIIPSEQPDESYQLLLSSLNSPIYEKPISAQLRISDLLLDNKLFANVFEGSLENADLPIVNRYFPFSTSGGMYSLALIKLQNGAAFLSLANKGKSGVYVFSTPFSLANTNFHKHAVFVPVMYRLALMSVGISEIYNVIGTNDNVVVKDNLVDSRTLFKIENIEKTTSIIPSFRQDNQQIILNTNQQLNEAGNYYLYKNDKKIRALSFNYNRKESEMRFFEKKTLDSLLITTQIKNVTIVGTTIDLATEIQYFRQGKQLWKSFVILALLFLIIEIILLRILKK